MRTLNSSSSRIGTLNPSTWWVLAIAGVILCTASSNVAVLAAISALSVFVVLVDSIRPNSESGDQKLKALRFYLQLAAFVLAVRVAFRLVFNLGFDESDTVLLELPRLAINIGIGEFQLLGPVSSTNLIAGAIDGFRLASIILVIAMANIQANPKVLLKSMPGALFEIASTVSVALGLAPQLIDSLQRVRRARRLRGRSAGITALPSLVIPVLEDTLERSLALAASLDSRGFGRTAANRFPRLARVTSLLSVALIGIGSYTLLADASTSWLAWSVLAIGAVCLGLALRLNSARGQRSIYNKAPWMPADFALIAIAGALVAGAWFADLDWLVRAL